MADTTDTRRHIVDGDERIIAERIRSHAEFAKLRGLDQRAAKIHMIALLRGLKLEWVLDAIDSAAMAVMSAELDGERLRWPPGELLARYCANAKPQRHGADLEATEGGEASLAEHMRHRAEEEKRWKARHDEWRRKAAPPAEQSAKLGELLSVVQGGRR